MNCELKVLVLSVMDSRAEKLGPEEFDRVLTWLFPGFMVYLRLGSKAVNLSLAFKMAGQKA